MTQENVHLAPQGLHVPHDLKLWMPHEDQLFHLFEESLLHWGKVDCAQLEWRGFEGPAKLLLERRLDFTLPHDGTLVVRCPEDFSSFLSDTVYGKREVALGREEALQEVMVLFWYRLACKFWKADPGKFRPALFKPSLPLDWPGRQPDVACLLMVQKFPVEVLLWAE